MIKVDQGENLNVKFLSGPLTIYQAEELFNEIKSWLKQGEQLIVDLGAVTEIDSAGVQLLLMTSKEQEAHGLSLSLVNHSKVVIKCFEALGVLALFSDPVFIAGSDDVTSIGEKGDC
ncbi:STAS domain-containing protein [Shewanella zhangzhouensis]|uniref:STAS domain-containing protein n=1 Tax=Shewanella zhangzhouensis TaxID=2864213 RepID=UPI001C66239E|nr:STAS domain-containing protein [Shewanella zhangzhouensis]QYK03559.1 STAS domain-containing protein [Shewanella zhangzhouensis]